MPIIFDAKFLKFLTIIPAPEPAQLISMSSGQDEASDGPSQQQNCGFDAVDNKEVNAIEHRVETAMEGIEFFDEVLANQNDVAESVQPTDQKEGQSEATVTHQNAQSSNIDNSSTNEPDASSELCPESLCVNSETPSYSQLKTNNETLANHTEAAADDLANQMQATDKNSICQMQFATDCLKDSQIRALEDARTNQIETADNGAANQIETADNGAANQIETADNEAANQIETADNGAANQIEATDSGAANQIKTADSGAANQIETTDNRAANQIEDIDNATPSQQESFDVATENQTENPVDSAATLVQVASDTAGNQNQGTDDAAANQHTGSDSVATNQIGTSHDSSANQMEAIDGAIANQSEVVTDALAVETEASENALVSRSEAINSVLPNLDDAVDDILANQSETFDAGPAVQTDAVNSSMLSETAPTNQSEAVVDSLLANQSQCIDNTPANHQLTAQDFLMADIKTEAASINASAASASGLGLLHGSDDADVEESEAARQAASWIEDASEAADYSTSANAAAEPKIEPMDLLEAKIEPTEGASGAAATAASHAVDRKPQVAGVNGAAPNSPSSQPCSSSASSQLPVTGLAPIPGLSKALENSLTRRQRHDLELIGSCPRCEKFREQIVCDENNEPKPGTNILPDYLAEGLDMVVIGINPSLTSAYVGHHYAGPGNHFWSCLSESGLISEPLTCHDDHRICEFGIGFTNVCTRPTKGAADLTRKEMKEGADILLTKLKHYKPKIAVFNGKGIYEAFVGNKNFYMGKQPEPLVGTDIVLFVMPSSSARCAQLPRAADKLPFYTALRKLRDYVVGASSHLNDADVVFTDYTEMRVTQPDPKSVRKAERRRKRKAELAQLNQAAQAAAAAEKARTDASAAAAAAAPSSAADSKDGVQAKIAAIQQQQQQQRVGAAAAVKVEAAAAAPAPAMPQQYAVLTQQPGHYEWQIYQPTLYYQLAAANPTADQAAGVAPASSAAAAAAAAAYLRPPQLQILQTADPAAVIDPNNSAAVVASSGSNSSAAAAAAAAAAVQQQLGFANLLLLDPSQLQAAVAAGAVGGGVTLASSVALMPSVSAVTTSTVDSRQQQQQQQHHLTYTTL